MLNKLYITVFFLVLCAIGVLFFFHNLDFTLAQRYFIYGLSLLTACISNDLRYPNNRNSGIQIFGYMIFFILIVVGLFKIDWKSLILSVFFLALAFEILGRFIKSVLNWFLIVKNNYSNDFFLHLNYSNIFFVIGLFLGFIGLFLI